MSLREILKIGAANSGGPKKDYLVSGIYDEYLKEVNGKDYNWDGEIVKREARGLHPSGISRCLRAQQYSWLGFRGNSYISPRLCRTFSIGKYLHKMVQTDLKRAGLLLFDEFPIFHNKYKILGHADGILQWKDGFASILEIKTINPERFKQIYAPSNEYLYQANTYIFTIEYMRRLSLKISEDDPLWGLLKPLSTISNKINQVNFYYLCKGTSAVKEFVIERDNTTVNTIKNNALEILNANSNEKLLPRLAKSPSKEPCYTCSLRDICWDKLNSEKIDWDKSHKFNPGRVALAGWLKRKEN